MHKRHLFAVGSLSLLLPGCFAVVVGAGVFGAVSYTNNEAWADCHADMQPVWEAALAALKDQGYPITGTPAPGPTEGTLTAGDARIIVEKHPGDFVRVRVRVGTFDTSDNERKARLLLDAIRLKVEKK
jgi:hypothetical protein